MGNVSKSQVTQHLSVGDGSVGNGGSGLNLYKTQHFKYCGDIYQYHLSCVRLCEFRLPSLNHLKEPPQLDFSLISFQICFVKKQTYLVSMSAWQLALVNDQSQFFKHICTHCFY